VLRNSAALGRWGGGELLSLLDPEGSSQYHGNRELFFLLLSLCLSK